MTVPVLGALDVDLSCDQLARLDAVIAVDLGFPHAMLPSDHTRAQTRGGPGDRGTPLRNW